MKADSLPAAIATFHQVHRGGDMFTLYSSLIWVMNHWHAAAWTIKNAMHEPLVLPDFPWNLVTSFPEIR